MLNGKPLVIDGYCGLGGWSEGFLAEGWECIGIDIERHDYGNGSYPGHLILQDMMTIHGKQFKDADCLVFSPPCQEYSYMAMPWSRAKAIAAEYRSGIRDTKKLTALFDACFRIQREAIEAAGHFIPMVVENVRGAQPWVGKARWNFGSYYLWGDVPALMPITMPRQFHGTKLPGNNSPRLWEDREVKRLCDSPVEGYKTQGMNWSDRSIKGQDFTRIAGHQAEGVKTVGHLNIRDGNSYTRHLTNQSEHHADGVKGFKPNGGPLGKNELGRHASKSKSRKAASAAIAKIPLPLARWIAKVYMPKK